MTFGTLGLPWCFALRGGPWPGAVQGESWQAKSRLAASFYSRFRKWRLAVWATVRGPDPSFTAMVFWPCEGVLGLELCRVKVGRQSQGQGLELVSSRFRKWRLALWAMGRGPDPSFTAMVFWPCMGVLGPELCRMKVGRQSQGLELVSIVGSESDVWQSGLQSAGPIRPSLPWCFGPARGSLARSCAG